MCSLSAFAAAEAEAEPALTEQQALVAAACAMIAGWMRRVGHVTAVVTGRSQTCEIAPIIDQTKGLSPCSLVHGWKWSLIHRASKPASSASRAC